MVKLRVSSAFTPGFQILGNHFYNKENKERKGHFLVAERQDNQ